MFHTASCRRRPALTFRSASGGSERRAMRHSVKSSIDNKDNLYFIKIHIKFTYKKDIYNIISPVKLWFSMNKYESYIIIPYINYEIILPLINNKLNGKLQIIYTKKDTQFNKIDNYGNEEYIFENNKQLLYTNIYIMY